MLYFQTTKILGQIFHAYLKRESFIWKEVPEDLSPETRDMITAQLTSRTGFDIPFQAIPSLN